MSKSVDNNDLDLLDSYMSKDLNCMALVNRNRTLYHNSIDLIADKAIKYCYDEFYCFIHPNFGRYGVINLMMKKIIQNYPDKCHYLGVIGGIYHQKKGRGVFHQLNSAQLLGGKFRKGSNEYRLSLRSFLHLLKNATNEACSVWKKVVMKRLSGLIRYIPGEAEHVPNFEPEKLAYLIDRKLNSTLNIPNQSLESNSSSLINIINKTKPQKQLSHVGRHKTPHNSSNHPKPIKFPNSRNVLLIPNDTSKYKEIKVCGDSRITSVGREEICIRREGLYKYISAVHFTMHIQAGTIFLTGKSSNGPYYKGNKVVGSVEVFVTDNIHIFRKKKEHEFGQFPIYFITYEGLSVPRKVTFRKRKNEDQDEKRSKKKRKMNNKEGKKKPIVIVLD